MVQFTPDGGVDGLPQGTVPGTVTSLLASPQANGSPAESPETRLALITQGDVSSDGKGERLAHNFVDQTIENKKRLIRRK